MQTASQIDEQSNSPKLAPVKMRLPWVTEGLLGDFEGMLDDLAGLVD